MVVIGRRQLYKTEPLRSWPRAKELRLGYYKRYATIKESGGVRWAGGAWAFHSVPRGLGDDVVALAGEPYAAAVAATAELSNECLEATEARGWARDLCAYMRNYFGSMYLDKYVFGGPFPKPDFCFQTHICCTHTKWYQHVSEYEGIPYFGIDAGLGPFNDMTPTRVDYLVAQLQDAIEWMEKVTGRQYDDEKLFHAVYNECRVSSLWAEICALNKAIPAPLDEKTMFGLYVLSSLDNHDDDLVSYYQELRDEVRYRVENQIAALATERCRLISDSQPPWSALKLWRHFEKFGAVSVGSLYTFGLIGIWDDLPDGTWGPAVLPQDKGVVLKTREDALRTIAEWTLRKPIWQSFQDQNVKTQMMLRIIREWHVDGAFLHYNRGCEGSSLGIAENRLGLLKEGVPVMSFEANMGDAREIDLPRILARADAFMESLGLDKLED